MQFSRRLRKPKLLQYFTLFFLKSYFGLDGGILYEYLPVLLR